MSLFAVLHLSQVVDDPDERLTSLRAQLADADKKCGEIGVAQLREQLVFAVSEDRMRVVKQVGDRDAEVRGQSFDGASARVGVESSHQRIQRGARDLSSRSFDPLDDLVKVESASTTGWAGEVVQLLGQRPRRGAEARLVCHQSPPYAHAASVGVARGVVTLAAPDARSQPRHAPTG